MRKAELDSGTITVHSKIIFIFFPEYLKRPGAEAEAMRKDELESGTISVHS